MKASWGSMFVFMGALAIAIASVVSVNSLRDNLSGQIQRESKSLLGADIKATSNAVFEDSLIARQLDAEALEVARELSFGSMAYAPTTGRSRLSRVRAREGGMPFYGDFETIPAAAVEAFMEGKGVLVDPSLLYQLNIQTGDSIRLGLATFQVLGTIEKLSGASTSFSVFGPRVLLPYSQLEATDLVKVGSRIDYEYFLKMPETYTVAQLDSLEDRIEDNLNEYRIRATTYVDQQNRAGRALGNIFNFLNLVGFSAILLGMIGMSVTINRFLKSKISAIAVLRCLGATPQRAKAVYWIQILLFGFIGSVSGILIGVILQFILPTLVEQFTDSTIEIALSINAISLGLFTGLSTAIAFSWAPMLALGQISPLNAIRANSAGNLPIERKLRILSLGFVALLTFVLAWLLVKDLEVALVAVGGLAGALVLLAGAAWLLIKAAYKLRSASLPYSYKQGLANLYRPGNQTFTSMITVGTGVLIMGVLFLSQQSLLSLLDIDQQRDQANMVFLDIQDDQKEAAYEVMNKYELPILQDVPIVTMRLSGINGQKSYELQEDTTFRGERWALRREYRSSYRDSITQSEKLLKGEWEASWDFNDQPVPISVEQGLMESLNLSIGDTLDWDIQGVPLQSYIASTREVDWQQISPNFFVIFPEGVLNYAPQFRVIVSREDDPKSRAAIQSAMVEAVPNVSVLDISALLSEVRVLLNQVSSILQVMGALSIVIGLIVMAGSIQTTQRMRIGESLLLRTIGARTNTLRKVLSTEYLALGTLSVASGMVLALGASLAINLYFFEIDAFAGWSTMLLGGAFLILGVVVLGYFSIRKVFYTPPLQTLRSIQD